MRTYMINGQSFTDKQKAITTRFNLWLCYNTIETITQKEHDVVCSFIRIAYGSPDKRTEPPRARAIWERQGFTMEKTTWGTIRISYTVTFQRGIPDALNKIWDVVMACQQNR